jgi:hypothetical protein
MRITTIAVAALLSFSAFAQSAPGVKWARMDAKVLNGIVGYINTETHKSTDTEHGPMMFAEILLSSKVAQSYEYQGKALQAKGLVRTVLVDCENSWMMVKHDLYFAEEFPKRDSTPLGGVHFGSGNVTRLDKSSELYENLCPNSESDYKTRT